MSDELTREELFFMLWERPTKDIARELGISDVALTKRCRKLQIPKPPRGYWAKIQAGKRLRKPLLKEFSEQLEEQQNKARHQRELKGGWLHLSPVQAELFRRAINELSRAGVDLGKLQLSSTGARFLNTEVAAQIILLIQQTVSPMAER